MSVIPEMIQEFLQTFELVASPKPLGDGEASCTSARVTSIDRRINPLFPLHLRATTLRQRSLIIVSLFDFYFPET